MSQNTLCIVLASRFPRQREKAAALAEKLGLSLQESHENRCKYHLVYTDIRLELQHNPGCTTQKEKPVYIDLFPNGSIHQRLLTTSIKDPLCKAVGIKSGKRPSIIDTTAGMGMDGITLAWLGCTVLLIERNPVVHALLHDGIRRAVEDWRFQKIIGNNLRLMEGNSTEILPHLSRADTVFVDPMYPETVKGGALNKKEMRMLREIVGGDIDSRELFLTALQTADNRVVVKRPKNAEPISPVPKPSHRILMKSGRFDVYLLPPKNHL